MVSQASSRALIRDVKPLLHVVVAVDSCRNLLEVDGAAFALADFAFVESFLDFYFVTCLLLLLDGGLGPFVQVAEPSA